MLLLPFYSQNVPEMRHIVSNNTNNSIIEIKTFTHTKLSENMSSIVDVHKYLYMLFTIILIP